MTVRLLHPFRSLFRPLPVCTLSSPLFLALLLAAPTFAEVRLVSGQGEHRLGSYDTKIDAEHFALEAAKRNALEQVATYLESVTVIRDMDVTTDEIRSYTAGLLLILDQRSTTRLEQNEVIIHADIVAQVDSDQVVAAITALRENEDARRQLVVLRSELDDLHQELEQANARLAAATDPHQIQMLTQQRQDLLEQTRSDDLLSQAWTGWTVGGANAAYAPMVGYAPPQALVIQAWQAAPWNQNVQTAQQKIIPATVLPQYARSSPMISSNPARLRGAVRPWSGLMARPRIGTSPSYAGPGLFPHPRMRPSMPPGPHYSGSGRFRGGGRGRR